MNAPKPNGAPHPFLPTHEHLESCDACIATHRELWAKHFGPEFDPSKLHVWVAEYVYREHAYGDPVHRSCFAATSEQAAIDHIRGMSLAPVNVSSRSADETFVATNDPNVWWRITSLEIHGALPGGHSS